MVRMERDGYENDINRLYIFNLETKEKYYIQKDGMAFIK